MTSLRSVFGNPSAPVPFGAIHRGDRYRSIAGALGDDHHPLPSRGFDRARCRVGSEGSLTSDGMRPDARSRIVPMNAPPSAEGEGLGGSGPSRGDLAFPPYEDRAILERVSAGRLVDDEGTRSPIVRIPRRARLRRWGASLQDTSPRTAAAPPVRSASSPSRPRPTWPRRHALMTWIYEAQSISNDASSESTPSRRTVPDAVTDSPSTTGSEKVPIARYSSAGSSPTLMENSL